MRQCLGLGLLCCALGCGSGPRNQAGAANPEDTLNHAAGAADSGAMRGDASPAPAPPRVGRTEDAGPGEARPSDAAGADPLTGAGDARATRLWFCAGAAARCSPRCRAPKRCAMALVSWKVRSGSPRKVCSCSPTWTSRRRQSSARRRASAVSSLRLALTCSSRSRVAMAWPLTRPGPCWPARMTCRPSHASTPLRASARRSR